MLHPYTTKIIYKIPWNTQLFYCSLLNVHFYWEYLQRKSNLFQLLVATLIFVDQTLTDYHFNGSYTTFLWCLSFPFRNFVPLMLNTCEALYQENLHPQLLFVSLRNASPFSGQVWYSVKQSKKRKIKLVLHHTPARQVPVWHKRRYARNDLHPVQANNIHNNLILHGNERWRLHKSYKSW